MRRTNYWLWFCHVAGWDGCLPSLMYVLPALAREWLPQPRGVIEWSAVVLPIVAFCLRCCFGIARISSNDCSMVLRQAQGMVFAAAAMSLIMIDAVFILSNAMPANFLFESTGDTAVWICLGTAYLAAMAFAMYPGCPAELE